ncbi:MAG: SoxR reducing system RseC family protein [Porphyromonas sp.]|nr:SoxR reducing system RseC family protein [Porphyromonas sp.]
MDCKIGIVRKIQGDTAEVLISRSSACASCHAKGACTSADQKEQLLTIRNVPSSIQVGDRVQVTSKPGVGLKAALFAFAIPVVLLVVVAVVLYKLSLSDAANAVVLLGVLVGYGLFLLLMRPYLNRELELRIEPLA